MNIHTLFIEPIQSMLSGVANYIPTLLVSLGILIIGWVVAKTVRKLLVSFMRAIHFDKITGDLGLDTILRVGGVKHRPSDMVACAFYWVFMVSVFITTIKSLGLTIADGFLSTLFAFIPNVIIGTLALVVGMLLAKVVSGLVYVTAKNTDMPIPETLRDLSKLAIVVYISIVYLKEIGFVALFSGANYSVFVSGIVFAMALAFGLAGKDIAGKYLSALDYKKDHK